MNNKQFVYSLLVKRKPFLFFKSGKEEELNWVCEDQIKEIEKKYTVLNKTRIGTVESFDMPDDLYIDVYPEHEKGLFERFLSWLLD